MSGKDFCGLVLKLPHFFPELMTSFCKIFLEAEEVVPSFSHFFSLSFFSCSSAIFLLQIIHFFVVVAFTTNPLAHC